MNYERVGGGLLGIVVLLLAFLTPFSDIAKGQGTAPETLYSSVASFVRDLGPGQGTQPAMLSYLYIAAGVLVVVAGLTGSFALVSGALGIAGMGVATLAPFAAVAGYSFSYADYGPGYWSLWVMVLVVLAFGALGKRYLGRVIKLET